MRKKFTSLQKTIAAVAAVLVLAAFIWWRHERSQSQPAPFQISAQDGSSSKSSSQNEYVNDKYHFSFSDPSDLKVNEYDEGQGAVTLTFENDQTLNGFQIFIVPYQGDKVTDQRFHMDVPSGVRRDLINIKVDGAAAAAFVSEDVSLGETREVWIIHGGYLYELTTPRATEYLLEEILGTWKFLN